MTFLQQTSCCVEPIYGQTRGFWSQSRCSCGPVNTACLNTETRFITAFSKSLYSQRSDVLSSPECPISGCGAGPAPSEFTAWTLISNGVYVPASSIGNGGDRTSVEFQCTLVPPALRHNTLYMKAGPLCSRLSISCKDTRHHTVRRRRSWRVKHGNEKSSPTNQSLRVLTSHVMSRVFGSVGALRTPVGFLSGAGGGTRGGRKHRTQKSEPLYSPKRIMWSWTDRNLSGQSADRR